jgi:hypothetical protein
METRLIHGGSLEVGPTDPGVRARLIPNKPGELKIYVTPVEGLVQVDFGTPVEWLKLTPEMAKKLADDLVSAAGRAAGIVLAGG